MRTWVPGAAGSAYDVDNLPYGVFSVGEQEPRVGVRVGEWVLDLSAVGEAATMARPGLDAFLRLGRTAWDRTRAWLVELLTDEEHRALVEPQLVPIADVTMHPPFVVADYVDFYCSLQHATNVGRIFRPDGEALLPNWRHLPVGYHGRAGTVVVSGTDVRRPHGQRRSSSGSPAFGPTRRLDIETELGFVVGTAEPPG